MVRIDRVLTILDFFNSPFFQLNRYFQGYRAIREISAHREIFAPPPPAPAHVYYNRAATQQRMVRIYCVLMILHFFTHLFFNYIAIFGAIAPSVISQPTAGFLPSCRRRPLMFIITKKRHKKEWCELFFF